ncbi:hypothetical protein [Caproiciproducens galactitolivorans]|uniref:Uncharacterized protein n=1 Tax=Caproiciproducens galactitolivorans TaxID=642589 RepID=A0ABT4BPK6_9FIRM|nr:hypothetical protein [Caproiciproducens galactitolivorans]MCY1712819.1 hypothetical protein [Caproiciproducens galactitolivorans]
MPDDGKRTLESDIKPSTIRLSVGTEYIDDSLYGLDRDYRKYSFFRKQGTCYF